MLLAAWAECAQANGWPLPSHSSEHVHSRPLWCVCDSLPSMRDRLSDDGGTHDDMPRRHCIDRILAICAFRVSIELYMCLLITSRSSMSHDVLIASRNSEYFHLDRSCFCLPISCCCARTFSDLNISKEWESFNITLRLLSKYDFSSGWLWTPCYIYIQITIWIPNMYLISRLELFNDDTSLMPLWFTHGREFIFTWGLKIWGSMCVTNGLYRSRWFGV